MVILGLDIGGATLKAATNAGVAWSRPFPLYRAPQRLAEELTDLVGHVPADRLAVTMTGELCDCFRTKAEGVRVILDAIRKAFPKASDVRVWQTGGHFVDMETAGADPWKTAAANWLALATFAAPWCGMGNALLLDIGSTTTDIIPIRHGVPQPIGRTDPDRLATSELLYQGVLRTPLCSLISKVTIQGRQYRTMAEWFATTQDAYLVLGDLAESPADLATADGRPATIEFAIGRLAHVIGSDPTRFSLADARELAEQIAVSQQEALAECLARVRDDSLDGRIDRVVLAGLGEFVARRSPLLEQVPHISLAERLGPTISAVACAFAVAMLAATPSPNLPSGQA